MADARRFAGAADGSTRSATSSPASPRPLELDAFASYTVHIGIQFDDKGKRVFQGNRKGFHLPTRGAGMGDKARGMVETR